MREISPQTPDNKQDDVINLCLTALEITNESQAINQPPFTRKACL